MIDNINPVFKNQSSCSSTENNSNHLPKNLSYSTHQKKSTSSKLVQTTTSLSNKELTKRKVRSDKGHDVKFPVSDELKFRFKTLLKQFLFHHPTISMTQTKFNTHLLRYSLQNKKIINWHLNYVDQHKYFFHTKLPEGEFNYIGGLYGLADQKGLSYRQTVFFMVVSSLIYFERKDDFNEIVQQITTFK